MGDALLGIVLTLFSAAVGVTTADDTDGVDVGCVDTAAAAVAGIVALVGNVTFLLLPVPAANAANPIVFFTSSVGWSSAAFLRALSPVAFLAAEAGAAAFALVGALRLVAAGLFFSGLCHFISL